MLNSLDLLAGKISPGSIDGQLDNNTNENNNNKLSHLNHNSIHPYVKPNFNHCHSNEHELNSICNKHKIMDINNMKEINETNLNINNNNNNNSTTINNNILNHNNIDSNNPNIEFDTSILLNSSLDGDQLEINSNDSLMSGDQPDPDYIKMFVGQVPKSMDEEQLKKMFEEYGRVHTINVLRDKVTGISKGCCFVTFYTRKAALKAQDALHNIKTLEGMHHPIQMKPADSENRNERKLFIGMLQKKLNENDVRKLFEGHGTIEECTVLRDQNGQSKGCAFVTFSTKQSAIAAIKALHQSQTMEGCSAPVVVKFADTQKEKEQKKLQQMQANLWNLTAANINIPMPQVPQQIVTPILANPQPKPNPILTTHQDVIAPSSLQLLQQLQSVGLHNQFLQAPQQETHTQTTASFLPQINVQNLTALAALTQPAPQPQPQPQPQLTNAATLLWSDPTGLTNQYFPTSTFQQFTTPAQLNTAHLTSGHHLATQNTMSSHHLSKQVEGNLKRNVSTAAAAARSKQELAQMILFSGPDGCNLFIYHLPQEFSDSDLASTFLPFGNVISAKVFIDKQTNLSKCFGFVSFDNPDSAQAAIKAMHGFQIGTKRLKVQLKKPKDASKPY